MITQDDTIAAIATALGAAGVGIIRISGQQSKVILETMFMPKSVKFFGFKPWTLYHGQIINQDKQVLDQALAVFMPGPKSFTGEDVVEFHCHGGLVILETVLEAVLAFGARLALTGEFTKRAFLNNKIDLAQAEAVAELISASNSLALKSAQNKLSGNFSLYINELQQKLLAVQSQLTYALDFSEDEVSDLNLTDLTLSTTKIVLQLTELIAAYDRNRCLTEAARVVLTGQVNAGKSSLLNVFLGRNRAIVTEIEGTTRDFLEEKVNLSGLTIKLIDTAGFRKTNDLIEQQGLVQTKAMLKQADLVLLVMDITKPLAEEDWDILSSVEQDKLVLVLNKIDKNPNFKLDPLLTYQSYLTLYPTQEKDIIVSKLKQAEQVSVSAKFATGIRELSELIKNKVLKNQPSPDESFLSPNFRQRQKLEQAKIELQQFIQALQDNVYYDLLSVQLELVCNCLSEITGQINNDLVLDNIFSQFCVGK